MIKYILAIGVIIFLIFCINSGEIIGSLLATPAVLLILCMHPLFLIYMAIRWLKS